MAADAYKLRIVMHVLTAKESAERGLPVSPNAGQNRTQRLSADDVVNNFLLFTDRADDKSVTIPTEDVGWVVDDFTADEDGADTTALQLIKGSAGTESFFGIALLNNLSTTPEARCQGLYKRHLSAGQRYAYKQLA